MVENQGTNSPEMVENQTAPEETTQSSDQVVQEQAAQQEQKVESKQAQNFRELREKAAQAERRAQEMEARLQEIMQQKEQSPQPSYDPEDLVSYKAMQQELQNVRAEMVETKLRTHYPDYEKVLTKENIERLRKEDPELADSIRLNPDMYKQGVACYKAIKRMQDYETYTGDRERVQENASKPRTLTSMNPQTANSPLSQANAFANGLTPELAAQLRKEMEDARKRR